MTAPLPVVFALYPGVTQLDFTGPLEVLSRLPRADCRLASVAGGTLELGGGLTIAGLDRLAELPSCDILCVPGGLGVTATLDDADYLTAIARLGRTARTITSVCTGSLLLAAAGLLRGKRAACHWAWRDLLADFGVHPDPGRVVRDGAVLTGGGVTAGIDLALVLLAEREGEAFAQGVQLVLEYAPAPPFDAGRPELAPERVTLAVRERLRGLAGARREAVLRAAERLRAVADA